MDKVAERVNRTLNQIKQDAHDLAHLRTLEESIVNRILNNAENMARMRNGDKNNNK